MVRSQQIIKTVHSRTAFFLAISFFVFFSFQSVFAQRIAILSDPTDETFATYTATFAQKLAEKFTVLDNDLAESAFNSLKISNRFNMSIYESVSAARVIGCDLMILIDNKKWRRIKLEADDYFERSAGIFIVDGKTGILKGFHHFQTEMPSELKAEKAMIDLVTSQIDQIFPDVIRPSKELKLSDLPIVPENEPDKTFRPPMPYKRISPLYTRLAYFQDIKATVDIEVSVNADGSLHKIDIIRWAGYGLDESVELAIKQMNWRQATRGTNALAMKVLLRYNFKKVERSE